MHSDLDKMEDVRRDLLNDAYDSEEFFYKHEHYHLVFVAKELKLVMEMLRGKMQKGTKP